MTTHARHLHLRLACRRTSDARMGGSAAPRRHDSRGLRSKARSPSGGAEGRLMTDVASLGVWPLGAFAWCVRSARAAPFRTRSLRAAILTSRLPPGLNNSVRVAKSTISERELHTLLRPSQMVRRREGLHLRVATCTLFLLPPVPNY